MLNSLSSRQNPVRKISLAKILSLGGEDRHVAVLLAMTVLFLIRRYVIHTIIEQLKPAPTLGTPLAPSPSP